MSDIQSRMPIGKVKMKPALACNWRYIHDTASVHTNALVYSACR